MYKIAMYFSEDEYKTIEELKTQIVPIITNKAGTMSPTLIRLCETIGHRHFPAFCTKCSSGRFNILTRLYYRWLDDDKEKKEKTKNKQTKNGKEEKSGDGKSVSKSNRKK